jgi:hypothetical protein
MFGENAKVGKVNITIAVKIRPISKAITEITTSTSTRLKAEHKAGPDVTLEILLISMLLHKAPFGYAQLDMSIGKELKRPMGVMSILFFPQGFC